MEFSGVAVLWLLQLINGSLLTLANPEARRLYDDLLTNYNRLIRPVGNNSDRLTVKMGLRLSQLIEVVSVYILPTFLYSIIFASSCGKKQIKFRFGKYSSRLFAKNKKNNNNASVN